MYRNIVVLFDVGKIPRILHNVDPNLFDSNNILINPILPRGIPPHRWKKGDGVIEILSDREDLQNQLPIILLPSKPKLTLKYCLLMLLSSLIISILLHFITR